MTRSKGYVIGLTGGIGSGKTTVSGILRRFGAEILDCDQVTRGFLEPGGAAYEDVAAAFGPDFLKPDGRVDRRKLGALVFAQPEQRALLMDLTYPRLHRVVRAWLGALGPGLAVVDAPLLVEAGLHRYADAVWVMAAPESLRLSRILKRDGLTPAEAQARLGAQTPPALLRQHAQVVIENDGDLPALERKISDLVSRIQFKKNLEARFDLGACGPAGPGGPWPNPAAVPSNVPGGDPAVRPSLRPDPCLGAGGYPRGE
jgi:dephospho-CoA kinase